MGLWHSEFRASFFSEWIDAGLPDPDRVSSANQNAWLQQALPRAVAENLDSQCPPALSPEIVSEVYGFGYLVSTSCADLFAIPHEHNRQRADWCGRFNLGISLFDYVCDELSPDPNRAIGSLPAFAQFSGDIRVTPSTDAGKVTGFLNTLSAQLLAELETEIGAPKSGEKKYGLWGAMDSMYAAELQIATTKLSDQSGPAAIITLLRTKSSEPFRVMAELTARSGNEHTISSRRAAQFGRALGDCYWLVDDARDVWADLDAGRWNYFLAAACEVEPKLNLAVSSPIVEAQLATIWRRHHIARTAARSTIRRFATALGKLAASETNVHNACSRLVDVMAKWGR